MRCSDHIAGRYHSRATSTLKRHVNSVSNDSEATPRREESDGSGTADWNDSHIGDRRSIRWDHNGRHPGILTSCRWYGSLHYKVTHIYLIFPFLDFR
jgi:hypothetical protein